MSTLTPSNTTTTTAFTPPKLNSDDPFNNTSMASIASDDLDRLLRPRGYVKPVKKPTDPVLDIFDPLYTTASAAPTTTSMASNPLKIPRYPLNPGRSVRCLRTTSQFIHSTLYTTTSTSTPTTYPTTSPSIPVLPTTLSSTTYPVLPQQQSPYPQQPAPYYPSYQQPYYGAHAQPAVRPYAPSPANLPVVYSAGATAQAFIRFRKQRDEHSIDAGKKE
ncbi:hypothetical protein BC829DRAFT_390710 [Chytridium lagenaria]|nr:hypothetical protein BC829DRAFT_390710 [Chytridium lagenaria]